MTSTLTTWGKRHASEPHDEKTYRLAAILGIEPYAAYGLIGAFRAHVYTQADDGAIHGAAHSEAMAMWPGERGRCHDAMVAARLIDVDGDRWRVRKWSEHQGAELAAREASREAARERKQRSRQQAMVTRGQPETVTRDIDAVTRSITVAVEAMADAAIATTALDREATRSMAQHRNDRATKGIVANGEPIDGPGYLAWPVEGVPLIDHLMGKCKNLSRDVVIAKINDAAPRVRGAGTVTNRVAKLISWVLTDDARMAATTASVEVAQMRKREIAARSPAVDAAPRDPKRERVAAAWSERRQRGEDLPPREVFIDEVLAGSRSSKGTALKADDDDHGGLEQLRKAVRR